MRSEKKLTKKLQELIKLKKDYEKPGADLEDHYPRKIGFLEGAIEALTWVLRDKK